jgi:hypothetical protein
MSEPRLMEISYDLCNDRFTVNGLEWNVAAPMWIINDISHLKPGEKMEITREGDRALFHKVPAPTFGDPVEGA